MTVMAIFFVFFSLPSIKMSGNESIMVITSERDTGRRNSCSCLHRWSRYKERVQRCYWNIKYHPDSLQFHNQWRNEKNCIKKNTYEKGEVNKAILEGRLSKESLTKGSHPKKISAYIWTLSKLPWPPHPLFSLTPPRYFF